MGSSEEEQPPLSEDAGSDSDDDASGDSSDDDDDDDDEVVREYIGGLDAEGRFHGRATVHYESGDTFRGRYAHGARSGRGTIEFEDGSEQTGQYLDDELEGIAVYSYPSGESIVAHYTGGIMEGPFEERDADGTVACSGTMRDGARSGQIEFFYPDGGSLSGTVDEEGVATGDDFVYSYPDGSALCGRWKDGEMASARFRTAEQMAAAATAGDDAQQQPPRKKQRRAGQEPDSVEYTHDPGTEDRISCQPLLQDPYEALRVFAKQSPIPNANEGLFARRALEEGEVACFYAGVRVGHELVDGRDWAENDNTLSIDDETVIDVPPKCVQPRYVRPQSRTHDLWQGLCTRYIPTSAYRATLGHKANHSFEPNARYEPYSHPRFGEIKCIRCVRDVAAGQEITCHYDYNEISEEEDGKPGKLVAPDWFLALPGSDKIGR